jgi:hypothetical protein
MLLPKHNDMTKDSDRIDPISLSACRFAKATQAEISRSRVPIGQGTE